uniref:DNA 3'-5' helicase n=1 Tax=Ganoderma boninense TaxID=34458 RepID=A0A5K1K5U7_9APHY|nr:Succinate-semialdehyde dehydrogenase (EC [Ganoderma boninense]
MSPSADAQFQFSSPAGLLLVRTTLAKHIQFEPHDWQLEGVCKMLDGKDLVAIIPTGGGKTGYFFMYMLMLLELSQNPSLCTPPVSIPHDPCMIVVYPTNGLEEEQAQVFDKVGLKTLVINAETSSVARRSGEDIWLSARVGIAMVLLSPEQLATRGFESLIQHRPFQSRFRAFGVDEIHLLNSWGLSFRQAFRQLGHARARLPLHVFVGTSATVLAGTSETGIYSFLGLHVGDFHLIRRSNLRCNVQTIFRTLTHGLGRWTFPDLKWILDSKRKTVIHCRTIALGFRVALFFWRCLPCSVDRAKRVRMYNALNWPSYNIKTRLLMREDPEAQIVIATATFMVGIDIPTIQDVVIVGALESADEHVQWEGRAGRGTQVSDARCITYVTSKSLEVARAICDGKEPAAPRGKKNTGKQVATRMDDSMARVLCAPCFSAEQDALYNNPPHDPPCSCSSCSSSLAPPSPLPERSCICSRCFPEPAPPPKEKTRAPDMNPVPRSQRISRKMRAKGVKELTSLRMDIYLSLDTTVSRSFPPEMLLPDIVIKTMLDRFALLETVDTLRALVKDRSLLVPHVARVWEKVVELREGFEVMRAKTKARAKEREALRRAAKRKRRDEEAEGELVEDEAQVSVEVDRYVLSSAGQPLVNAPGRTGLGSGEETFSFEWQLSGIQ